MEFISLIGDMPMKVTCKFEMLIFKGSQVIKYYVMFAFLFVQTVYSTSLSLSIKFVHHHHINFKACFSLRRVGLD